MKVRSKHRRQIRLNARFLMVLCIAMFGGTPDAHAVCGLYAPVLQQLRTGDDLRTMRGLDTQNNLCAVCHLSPRGGPRNVYGNAINVLLTLNDREDPVRQRDAGGRIDEIPANPSLPDSPTFGELFRQGRLPASALTEIDISLPKVPPSIIDTMTVAQARALVQRVEAEARFGILQLSQVDELSTEVAATLADFEGETLILGIKSLTHEVATVLANSRAANVWLHSVTSVSPEAAEAIAKLRGHLVLTGLTELTSVPLAAKLATRPVALSFPYLKTISPEIATALATHQKSLTLAGLTDLSQELQATLAATVGALSLPNLTSIDSPLLAKKLASSLVLLTKLKKLSAEDADMLVGIKGQGSFFGAAYFDLAAMTPEVVDVIAKKKTSFNLILTGDALSDATLRTLMQSSVTATLQDVEELTPAQINILTDGLSEITDRPGVLTSAKLSLPKLRKLESAQLAEALVRSTGFNFPSVTAISTEVAAALGNLPDQEFRQPDGTVDIRPTGELNFPSLETLSPETAELLLKKRWLSITLPALRDVSPETVRKLARQTFRLTVGIQTLTPEFAYALAATPTDKTMGGGFIVLPNLQDVTPEAARILVNSLNRGVKDLGYTRLTNSPKLYLGGDLSNSSGGLPTVSPDLARELAKYEGTLAIPGLGELPDESAAALASFPGPYLFLSGPAAEKLSPIAATELAKVPGNLNLPLRELDSIPLAQRFARQTHWTLSDVESISPDAASALSQYKPFFNIRVLAVLDSPVLARRLIDGTTSGSGITLPALTTLSNESAEIFATGAKPLFLGLRVIDSPTLARTLAKAQAGVKLPRLQAATPEVIAILREAKFMETPPLESLFILSN